MRLNELGFGPTTTPPTAPKRGHPSSSTESALSPARWLESEGVLYHLMLGARGGALVKIFSACVISSVNTRCGDAELLAEVVGGAHRAELSQRIGASWHRSETNQSRFASPGAAAAAAAAAAASSPASFSGRGHKRHRGQGLLVARSGRCRTSTGNKGACYYYLPLLLLQLAMV